MGKTEQLAAECRPSLRWHCSRIWSTAVYRRAFASFGRGSVIVAPSRLRNVDRIGIGSRCAIYEGAWLQAESKESWLGIGSDCYLGLRSHLHAVERISIGARCVVADDVFISDSEHVPGDLMCIRSRGPISIGDDVFLGVKAVVLGGVTIGNGAIVGAGSVVTRDVPPGIVVAGVPARPVRGRTAIAATQ